MKIWIAVLNLKRKYEDPSDFMRKKKVKSNLKESANELECDEDEEHLCAELLNAQTIREGMLLLGCVMEIRPTFLVISLPGCLSGRVPLTKISNAFTRALESFNSQIASIEPSVHTFIKVGMVFPCKVIQISQDVYKRRPVINLSINPEDVNAELKPTSLYPKMVLYVTVCSVEDHGYVVDVGVKNIHGFLSRQGSEDTVLKTGEVIPTYIKKINFSNKVSAKIQLSKLDFNDDFPEIAVEDLKLSAVLPGAKIQADVIDIKHPFVYLKYLCFDACASVLSLGSTYKAISVGSTITGTVLYVHPITHTIYLMLNLKPSPELFAGYFGLKKFEIIRNLKFQYIYKKQIYYKISKGTYGFIRAKDLPLKVSDLHSLLSGNSAVSKACVVQLHYMDNLVQMSGKPSLTEKNIILAEDVKIGDIYEATVQKHVENGVFVQICVGLNGFIRKIHMADVFVTKPDALFPVGKSIKCRVLSKDRKGKLIMTCKESLLSLPDHYILSSYEKIQQGQIYKGVVGKICNEYILILFFNDVKGIVPATSIPQGSVFFEGQTVLCEVRKFNSIRNQLILSLKTAGRFLIEELEDIGHKTSGSFSNITHNKDSHEMGISSEKKSPKVNLKKETVLSYQNREIDNQKYLGDIPVAAKIINVKGSQLNILLNKDASDFGRVHITKLGCTSENVYPLRDFSAGQVIQVYVTGETRKKKKNFLSITHKNFVSLKECSLIPLSASLSNDLSPGSSLIGYVKKVYDLFAVLWLTPTKVGILDYLHFSENLKIVKKLYRHLKIGLSLQVSVMENKVSSTKSKGKNNIMLTKIEMNVPQVGKNVIGLVQVANFEKGLSLKLPFDYHGFACVTDLTDMYMPVQTLFNKFQRSKYLLCHVLEVNHKTRTCQLSLRKSRVYGQNIVAAEYCPEVTSDNMKEGLVVKGYVKSISDMAITVVLGRNLEGKFKMHRCRTSDCEQCKQTKQITDKYTVGTVAEVIILKNAFGKEPYTVAFKDYKTLPENTEGDRINIDEEISWDEIE